jgi:4-hydroxybenzoate polyprenyltransferase
MAIYQVNKGINKPIEFKGLKAQYIGYLGGGLVMLLILFAVIYICGLSVYLCLLVVAVLGGGLFYQVFQLSHKYGQYGLMKKTAKRSVPRYLKFNSRKLFIHLKR